MIFEKYLPKFAALNFTVISFTPVFLLKEPHNKWLTKTFSTKLLFHGSLLSLERKKKKSDFFGLCSQDSKWKNCIDNSS